MIELSRTRFLKQYAMHVSSKGHAAEVVRTDHNLSCLAFQLVTATCLLLHLVQAAIARNVVRIPRQAPDSLETSLYLPLLCIDNRQPFGFVET